ncbi:twin-arginine translocase TatA/TatE family subunit [Leucobacter chromiiresistens]|uniref:Sec-independent protein translocase protein TatA n=1 Tax=Leucobacter chromiiresistens TaxID=1079994 RepID=A0A1H0YW14_9MICO|nr:twin-arginine translocase TatA/TatE family subunit [Leucobacter chromiiresistens]SDQ19324.1 sec-independent protein translocase protein TatA [Leucobacter chromiiresistens]
MLGNLTGMHLVAILFIILLMFGAPKLPALAKSLGQSMKILRKEVGSDAEKTAETTPSTTQTDAS